MSRAFTASTVALAVALLSANGWAQAPQPPKAVPEAPAMGGEPQTKSGPSVIAPRANEVQLSRLANASLIRTITEKLGQLSPNLYGDQANTKAQVPEKIGTLTSAILDPKRKEITAVGVDTGAGHKIAALPWSQIRPIHQPNDQFQTAMTAKAIAAAPAFAPSASGLDVEQGVIGRPVVASDGKTVGTVSDVVAQIKSGTLDYIVVKPSGPQLGSYNAPRAVPWAKLKSITGNKSQPITLALNDRQLAALPVFGGSKAQETAGMRAAGAKVGAAEPPPP